jgi:hypothetical protein
MAPFEALYGRKCITPLLRSGVGEQSLFGPDIIKDAEEKVHLIRDRLKIAQSRQKSYADSKRRKVTYEVGDRAYLRLSPLRGVKRFGVKGKLAPRFEGPFKVLARKGEVAYELELPESLSAVHNVFHVSQLKKCHPEMANTPLRDTIPLEEVQLESDLTSEEKPIKILETSERVTQTKTIKFCKVQWSHHTEEDATCEREYELEKTTRTYLLANPNLEGEIHLKGVRLVTSQNVNKFKICMHAFIAFSCTKIHRKCTTPLLWSGVGEQSLFGPVIIKDAEEKVRLIKR